MADALEHRVGAVAPGELAHLRDALLAALGDDVGGAELQAQVGAGLVPAHQDDLLGAQPLGREHRQQADRAVADHRDRGPGVHACRHRGVVAGDEDVGQRQQRGQQRGVLTDRRLDEGAVGLRDADRLGLRRGEEPAVHAVGRPALAAELAGVVEEGEGGDHEVAGLHGADRGAGLLDDADELVAHRPALGRGRHRVVRVQVAAADAGAHHADQCVGGLLQRRVGHVLHAHVAGAVHECCSHEDLFHSVGVD